MNIFNRNPKKSLLFFILSTILFLDLVLTNTFHYISNYGWSKQIDIRRMNYGHDYTPKTKTLMKTRFGDYNIITNSLGFRDKSTRDIKLNSDKKRILFIGDSFTDGIFLDYEKSFVGIIDSTLNEYSIEVLNGGVTWYSPVIYFKKIEYLVDKMDLDFDELIIFIDYSDWHNEYYSFRISNDSSRVIDLRKTDNSLVSQNNDISIEYIKAIIYNNTLFTYFILDKIHDLLSINEEEQLKYEEEQLKLKNQFSRPRWDSLIPKWKELIKKDYSKESDFIIGMESCKFYLDKIYSISQKKQFKISIALYPSAGFVYGIPNEPWINSFKDWSRKKNIKMYDFFKEFETIQSSNNYYQTLVDYYLPNDIHFNEKGNRFIAYHFLKIYLNTMILNK